MRLSRDDIISGLTELATRMDAASIAATIHVIGGSAISIEYNHLRESTTDVDSWLHVHHTLVNAVDAIVRDIAIRRQWPDDWFNTKATTFMPEYGSRSHGALSSRSESCASLSPHPTFCSP